MTARLLSVPLGPGQPEIALLRPADQEALLAEALARGSDALPDLGTPYYAELWPAAVPLARWLMDERVVREGTRVLELGCGLGLVGLALAKVARCRVALTDGSPAAVELVREAARLNAPFAHEPLVERLDWRDPEAALAALGGRFPVVIGADVLYEPASFAALARCARACLREPEGALYLAEPQRPIARGAETPLREVGLELVERARASNGVIVQCWVLPRGKSKGPRCG